MLQRDASFADAARRGWAVGVFACLVVTETIDYYDIDGGARMKFAKISIGAGRPMATNTRTFMPECIGVRWQYTSKRTAGSCEIASASTAVDVTYSFPRLSSDSGRQQTRGMLSPGI
jgi:predicted secreted Zn-dependent protease